MANVFLEKSHRYGDLYHYRRTQELPFVDSAKRAAVKREAMAYR